MTEPDPVALASVSDLAERLPFVMSTDDQREASGALEDLSDEARFYGRADWTTLENTPREVKNLVLKAAARHMKNPEGYNMSAAGDERVGWADRKADPEEAGSATFTPAERQRLADLAGNRLPDFGSVGMFAWENRPVHLVEGRVPDGAGTTFPLFSCDENPW